MQKWIKQFDDEKCPQKKRSMLAYNSRAQFEKLKFCVDESQSIEIQTQQFFCMCRFQLNIKPIQILNEMEKIWSQRHMKQPELTLKVIKEWIDSLWINETDEQNQSKNKSINK